MTNPTDYRQRVLEIFGATPTVSDMFTAVADAWAADVASLQAQLAIEISVKDKLAESVDELIKLREKLRADVKQVRNDALESVDKILVARLRSMGFIDEHHEAVKSMIEKLRDEIRALKS